MQHQVEDEDITENEFKMLLRPSLAKYFNNLYLADGGADHDIQILAKVSWIDDDGTVIEQIFAYAPENVTSVYKTTNQGLNILISGIKDLNKVTATAIIKSVTTGVQIAGDSITIK